MRFRTPLETTSIRPDLTPLIDVVFLLLIFFMLTASFVENPNVLTVALPETAGEGANAMRDTVVTITADNKVWMGEAQIPSDGLAQRLSQELTKKRLTILGDRRARLGVLVGVWDAARLAGFEEVSVATEPRKEKVSL